MGIIEFASILSACLVVIGTCWKTFNTCHQMLNKIQEFEELQKRNEMHIMKLGLFNDGLPLVDRIQCGKRYIELGGNGTGKIQYDLLIKEMEHEINHHHNQ
jgi:hypothetical protein